MKIYRPKPMETCVCHSGVAVWRGHVYSVFMSSVLSISSDQVRAAKRFEAERKCLIDNGLDEESISARRITCLKANGFGDD